MLLGGQRTQELVLLLDGLEATMTVLGGSIDELEVDWFQVRSLGDSDQTLSQGDWALLGASNAAFKHNPILVDLTVVREATNRGDTLLSKISFSGSGVLVVLLANAQHTLVDLSAVVVTHLTGTSDGEADTGRVPSTDTGNLAETTVGLARKTSNAPSADDTVVSVTLGGSANVQSLTLSKDSVDWDFLFEQTLGEINLGTGITTVDLDFQQVGDLLAQLQLSDLGVSQNADNLAELLDAVELVVKVLWLLSSLLGILGESLSLGSVPVLVESALDFIRKMTSPDGGQGAKAVWSSNVTDNTDNNHWRGLQDGDGFDGFLLV